MNFTKIYFDMDGVLANFNKGVEDLCGLTPLDQGHSSNKQVDTLFNAMSQVNHFYGRLEPITGALELILEVYEKYGDKCEILSGIPKPNRHVTDAKDDKIDWAHRLISCDLTVNIVYREQKKNYCKGSDYILIDDFEKNINEWEAMGGTGVLFEDVESTRQKLIEMGIL